jgi:hypothetical protein
MLETYVSRYLKYLLKSSPCSLITVFLYHKRMSIRSFYFLHNWTCFALFSLVLLLNKFLFMSFPNTGPLSSVFFFPWRWGGSSTKAWMPTYVSILRIPHMKWVWRATVEWYIDSRKLKNSEKNLFQCHFVHHKSHMDWPGCEPRPPRWGAGD